MEVNITVNGVTANGLAVEQKSGKQVATGIRLDFSGVASVPKGDVPTDKDGNYDLTALCAAVKGAIEKASTSSGATITGSATATK